MTYRVSSTLAQGDVERGFHTCTFVEVTAISEFVTVAIAALDMDDVYSMNALKPSKRKALNGF